MDRLLDKREEGFTTCLVMVMVVVLGIVLAGLLPMGGNIARSAAFSQNVLQAQYNAEAGAKRAIAALSNGNTDWGWLEHEINVTDDPTLGTYNVTKDLKNGTYIIRSEGITGGFIKKATVQVNISTGTVPLLDNSSIIVGENICSETPGTNPTLHANGFIRYHGKVSDIHFDGDVAQPDHVTYDPNISLPSVDYDTIISAAKKEGKAEPFKAPINLNDNTVLSAGKVYYSNTRVNISGKNIDITGPTSGYAMVVIHGNLELSADTLHLKNNVVFLVTGSFTLNSATIDCNGCFVYCNENACINQSGSNFTCQVVSRRSLILKNSLWNSNPCPYSKVLQSDLNNLIGGTSVTVSNWAKQK